MGLKHTLRKATKSVFGSKGKKVWNYLSNPLRAAQRSHKFGHTSAPSWSDKNQITRLFNQAMTSLGKSAMRAAERQVATQTGNSSSTASQAYTVPSVNTRLDYRYRRLSDLT